MKINPTPISDLFVVETTPFQDDRGKFMRCFCQQELSSILKNRQIVQINHSITMKAGGLRGMHFQNPPFSEMKFIRCLRGKVWDVAVDLRYGSSTFLSWHFQELSPENNLMMVIPEGFAHGFQVLDNESELLYLHTEYYKPDTEGGFRFDDPRLSIKWPLKPIDLSKKDINYPFITDDFKGLIL